MEMEIEILVGVEFLLKQIELLDLSQVICVPYNFAYMILFLGTIIFLGCFLLLC